MSRILVTGGAGYIGSHTVKALIAAGHEPVVLDDFSEGHREAVPPGVEVVVGEIGSRPVLDGVLEGGGVDAAIHFAARCYVGVSVREPRAYYRNNVAGTLNVLDALVASKRQTWRVPAIQTNGGKCLAVRNRLQHRHVACHVASAREVAVDDEAPY